VRARRAEAEQLRAELVELDAAGGEGDPPFEYLTRRWGFFYVDTLGRWLEEVEQGLAALTSCAGARHRGR
jgi:hypothetical protein